MNKPITFSIPFTKFDEEQRTVTGIATAEVLDKQNEIVDYEASKKAFSEWSGNIREMHGDKAVAKSIDIQFDDENKAVILTSKVSKSVDGENAWIKIKEGVLTGYSIGGSVYEVSEEVAKSDTGGDVKARRIKSYGLAETSFVDNPACPVAEFLMVKSADGKLETAEKMVEHKKPMPILGWQKTFVYSIDQYQAMQKNQAAVDAPNVHEFAKRDDLVKGDEENKVDEQPKTPSGDDSGDEGKTERKPDGEAAPTQGEPQSPKVNPSDGASSDKVEPPTPPAVETDKSDKGTTLRKDLYSVGSLADCLACLTSIRDWCVMEQEWEGDDSTVPAQLTSAIENLGGILTTMAQEESAEAAATGDDLLLSANAADLEKKLTATIQTTTKSAIDNAAELIFGKVAEVIKPLGDRIAALEHQPAVGDRPVATYYEVDKAAGLPPAPVVQDPQSELVKRFDELKAIASSRKNDESFKLPERQKLADEMWKLNKKIHGVTTAQLDPSLAATYPQAFRK